MVTGKGWWLRVGGPAPGIRRNSLEFRFQLVDDRSKPTDSAPNQTVPDVFMAASRLRADSPFPLLDCAGLDRKRHKRRLNNSSLLGCLFWFSLQKRCAIVVPTKSLPQICQAGGCQPRPSKTTEPTLGRNRNPDLLTSKTVLCARQEGHGKSSRGSPSRPDLLFMPDPTRLDQRPFPRPGLAARACKDACKQGC